MSVVAGNDLILRPFDPMEPEIRLSVQDVGRGGWFMSSFKEKDSSIYHSDLLGRHAWVRFDGISNQFGIGDLSSGRFKVRQGLELLIVLRIFITQLVFSTKDWEHRIHS